VTGTCEYRGTLEKITLGSGDGLARLLGQSGVNANDEITMGPAFCVGRTVVLDLYEHRETERVVMFFGLPCHPDMNIVLSLMAGVGPAPRLPERHAVTVVRRPMFMWLALRHLREAASTINGIGGDELVIRVRKPNFPTGYLFRQEMNGC
jgi:hypothetical protein